MKTRKIKEALSGQRAKVVTQKDRGRTSGSAALGKKEKRRGGYFLDGGGNEVGFYNFPQRRGSDVVERTGEGRREVPPRKTKKKMASTREPRSVALCGMKKRKEEKVKFYYSGDSENNTERLMTTS